MSKLTPKGISIPSKVHHTEYIITGPDPRNTLARILSPLKRHAGGRTHKTLRAMVRILNV